MHELRSRRGTYSLPHLMRWRDRAGWPNETPIPLVGPHTRVAAIGSCFAERITEVLQARGVPTTFHPAGLQYNTASIRQEFRQLFEAPLYGPDDVVRGDDGVWEHLFQKEYRSEVSRETVLEQARLGDARARKAYIEAEVVVVTLGLTEVWERISDGLVAVELPPAPEHAAGRWRFRDLTTAENLDNLRQIVALIRAHTTARVLMTVSPVPLQATFRPRDVIVANVESKSRLRAALADLVAEDPEILCFHSYELVSAWQGAGSFFEEDGRHVNPQGVAFIMNEFLRMFGQGELATEFVPFGSVAMPDQTLRRRFRQLRGRVAKRARQLRGLEG